MVQKLEQAGKTGLLEKAAKMAVQQERQKQQEAIEEVDEDDDIDTEENAIIQTNRRG